MTVTQRNPMRLTLTILVVLSFLVVGMLLGRAAGLGGLALLAPTPVLADSHYLVLGYDDLEHPAQLLAVWRVTLEGTGRAQLLGISPATVVFLANGQPVVLRDLLRDPANPTLDGLQAYFERDPQAIILIDSYGFATVVNRLGGAFLDGRRSRPGGYRALAGIRITLEALYYQSQILRARFAHPASRRGVRDRWPAGPFANDRPSGRARDDNAACFRLSCASRRNARCVTRLHSSRRPPGSAAPQLTSDA
jgi:hypothetical protein